MTSRGVRLGSAVLLLLAGCQAPAPEHAAVTAPSQAAPPVDDTEPLGKLACRDDVDGTVVVTDRGIGGTGVSGNGQAAPGGAQTADRGMGGTGINNSVPGSSQTADRGMGGTGIDNGVPGSSQTADRGIGGTGISAGSVDVPKLRGRAIAERGTGGTGVVGIITGFASICLNGVEVGIKGTALVTQDGVPSRSATLRLGEFAAIDASGSADGLRAVSIAIRHEVSGPVTRAGANLEVAGQRVMLDKGARAPAGLATGDWVAVSGLRDLTGTVHASRIDRREPGKVTLSGRPVNDGAGYHLFNLAMQFAVPPPAAGERVVMTGSYAGGTMRVEALHSDRVVPDSGSNHRLIVEGYGKTTGAELRLSQGLSATIGPNFGAPPPVDQPSVFEFVSDSAASLVAVSWHPSNEGHRGESGAAVTIPPVAVAAPPAVTPPVTAPAVPTVSTPATETAAAATAAPTSSGGESGSSAATASGVPATGSGGRDGSGGDGAGGGDKASKTPAGATHTQTSTGSTSSGTHTSTGAGSGTSGGTSTGSSSGSGNAGSDGASNKASGSGGSTTQSHDAGSSGRGDGTSNGSRGGGGSSNN